MQAHLDHERPKIPSDFRRTRFEEEADLQNRLKGLRSFQASLPPCSGPSQSKLKHPEDIKTKIQGVRTAQA
jgi:hypothetical protein